MRHLVGCAGLLCLLGCEKPVGVEEPKLPPPAVEPSLPAIIPVNVFDQAFIPATVSVRLGGGVRWIVYSAYPHRIVADDGSFWSPQLQWGKAAEPEDTISWVHYFTTPGTYGYHCGLHPRESGTVTVMP